MIGDKLLVAFMITVTSILQTHNSEASKRRSLEKEDSRGLRQVPAKPLFFYVVIKPLKLCNRITACHSSLISVTFDKGRQASGSGS